MQPAPTSVTTQPKSPGPGTWSLEYHGGCSGREAEALRITRLDETAIVFDEFHLLRGEAGDYSGSAIFIAPMPVDGREIPYEISYALKLNETGGISGSETIVEDGGQGIACPIELLFVSAQ